MPKKTFYDIELMNEFLNKKKVGKNIQKLLMVIEAISTDGLKSIVNLFNTS